MLRVLPEASPPSARIQARLRREARLVEQCRERHARPLAARQQAVRLLHVPRHRAAPVARGVPGALEEIDARHGRKADEIVHREDERPLHQPVQHQPVLRRIDVGHPAVLALEGHAGRSDDAVQVLERRERHALGRHDRRSLELDDVLLELGGQAVRAPVDRLARLLHPLRHVRRQVRRLRILRAGRRRGERTRGEAGPVRPVRARKVRREAGVRRAAF